MITLGENFASTIFGYIQDLFSDISPLVFIIIGLALAFWIIETIIRIITGKKETETEL